MDKTVKERSNRMTEISVIIPTYNRGEFTEKAIKSVMAQTYKDYEIIVVDDGSTDDTKERIKAFGDQVRYIYQENKGPSAARNTAIQNAKGKYIAFCDSDDRFLPTKLEEQMKFIKNNPECRFLYTWYYNVNEQGEITKLRKPLTCQSKEHLQYCLFSRKFTIRTSTLLVHKSCFDKAGLFHEKYLYSQDWDMWLRLAAYYRGYCLEKPLSEYWLHGDNRSSLSVKVYHPEIRENALKLYGWDDHKIARLEKVYDRKKKEKNEIKVAFICTDRGPCPPVKGGAIQLLISKVAPFIAKSHKVTVFSITDPDLSVQEEVDRVRYERFDRNQFFHRVLERVREEQFDIIQVYNRPGWVSPLRQAAPKAKLVLSLHNLVFDTLKADREDAACSIQAADRILTVSRFVADDTMKKIPGISGKTQVLYTGADINEYAPIWTEKGKQWRRQIRSLYHVGNDDPVLLFVGRLVSAKGCHLILNAMEEILNAHKKTKLLIVGSKWYADESSSAYIEKLKSSAKQVPGSVIFTSYVPVNEIPRYFSAADLFICPSQWKEPLARVHYEAMAAGLPIVTTERGGNPELFKHGKDAMVIKKYKEPKAFAKAVTKLLDNPELAKKMGMLGRKKAEETYNFKRVASDLESIYASFILSN
ncbi:glycosyltransferase [Sporolactobacillus sp. THM7-4]|nr:glycosyltransferase [Sporolactobacillus sp. THM7-4]